jgi:hypothetical protein
MPLYARGTGSQNARGDRPAGEIPEAMMQTATGPTEPDGMKPYELPMSCRQILMEGSIDPVAAKLGPLTLYA